MNNFAAKPLSCRLRKPGILLCVAVCFQASILVAVTRPKLRVTRVILKSEGDIATTWTATHAELKESFNEVRASVAVKNISKHGVVSAFFYGEYYDRLGRLCSTALFDLSRNEERESGTVSPKIVRTLVSSDFDMAIATRPYLLRLYLVRQTLAGKSHSPTGGTQGIRVPVTISGVGKVVSEQWYRLCLGPDYERRAPVLDVAFGVAEVDAKGRLKQFEVLDALTTRPFESWAQQFVTHLRFTPARKDGAAINTKTLLLFRVGVRAWPKEDGAFLARSNPWVVNYVESQDDREIPPINVVMLYAPPQKTGGVGQSTLPSCFEYPGAGTDWSSGISR